MFFGAGSLGLIFGIIFVGVFFGGCVMFLIGGIGFGVSTAKHKKKRLKVAFLIIAIIGAIMILIPSLFLYLMRRDNAEERADCIETEYNTQYHNKKIDGKNHDYFEYDGKKYIEVCPDSITEEDIETMIPKRMLVKDKAVLNIHEHIDFMDRLFSDYDQATVFSVNSDFGEGIMVTGACVFCFEEDLKKAESYYEDFSHYDFYIDTEDDSWKARQGKPVNIGSEMKAISELDLSKTTRNPTGKEVEVSYISKDDLFEGYLTFKIRGNKAYLFIRSYDTYDSVIDKYFQIPDDIAKSLILKIQEN